MSDIQDTITITGSKKREMSIHISLSVLYYTLITAFAALYNGISEMTFIYGFVCLGEPLGVLIKRSFKDLYIIEISHKHIKGPSTGISSQTIPIDKINRDMTRKQSIWAKISGFYCIYSNIGDKIIINSFVFDRSQRDLILKTLALK
jgi:hypothetical protein